MSAYNHDLCHHCRKHPRRPDSPYCSDECEAKKREQNRKAQNKIRENPHPRRKVNRDLPPARCPVCGDLISALKDCRCP